MTISICILPFKRGQLLWLELDENCFYLLYFTIKIIYWSMKHNFIKNTVISVMERYSMPSELPV